MKLLLLLYYFLIVTIPLGQFSRLPILGGEVTVYLNDVVLVLSILLLLITLVIGRKSYKLPPLFITILIFTLITGSTLIFSKKDLAFGELLISSLYYLRWILYASIYFGIYYVIKNCKDKEKMISRFCNLLVFSALLLGLFGLIQFVLFPDFSSMVAAGWDPHYYRVLSTFFDPNFVGGYYVLNLTLILSLFLFGGMKKQTALYFITTGVLFVAIILTFSRSSYLTLIISLGILGILKSRKLLVVVMLSVVLSFLLIPKVQERVYGVIGNIDASAQARFSSWEHGLTITQDNLITGVGYNTYRYAQMRYGFINSWETDAGGHSGSGVDSSMLLILATTGIFGFLFYFLIYLQASVRSVLVFFSGKSGLYKGLSMAILCGMAGLLCHSLFVNSLLYPWIMEFIWILLALRDGMREDVEDKPKPIG